MPLLCCRAGYIYDNSTGTRLATTGSFSDAGCGAGQWVRAPLTSPLSLTPGRAYIAVVDNVLYYPSTWEFFLTTAKSKSGLSAPRRAGVAGPAGSVPRLNFRDKNYYVDIEWSS